MTQLTINFDAPRIEQIVSVAEHAIERGFDPEAAGRFIIAYLASGPAFSQDVVDAACLAGFEPHDRRAFGLIFMQLKAAGKIVKSGYVNRRNGSPGLVWSLAGGTNE